MTDEPEPDLPSPGKSEKSYHGGNRSKDWDVRGRKMSKSSHAKHPKKAWKKSTKRPKPKK